MGILPKRVYGAWGWGTRWPKKKRRKKKNVRVAGWPIECIQKHARLPLFLQGSTSSFFFFFVLSGYLSLFLWCSMSFSLVDLFVVI